LAVGPLLLITSLPNPPITVSSPPKPAKTWSLPPLPKMMSPPPPPKMESLPSLESSPPTIVWAELAASKLTVSAPALPNVCIEPVPAGPNTLSFSLPPLTVPVLPVRKRTLSLPESPVTVESPDPVEMVSSPARPMTVPGPVSPDWFSVSLPAVPVAE
jgi:hypothetical protein